MFIIYGIIDIVFWVIEVFLGLRFLLKFFGANSAVPFVKWVYMVAQHFLGPFVGVFPTYGISGGKFVIEFSTLFAIIVYILIYYLILWILSFLLPPPPFRSIK